MTKTRTPARCERCAALEAWISKALTLFTMIGEEWPGTTWLQRQIGRAKAQCPVTAAKQEEEGR